MAKKTFFKCRVYGDVHYGVAGPEICPNCHTKNSYDPIDEKKAKETMGF